MNTRREFITLLGGTGLSWSLAAQAQQAAMPVVGFLRSTSLASATHLVTAFRQGLKEAGFVEGQNVAIEFRSADDRPDRLPALAAELVRRPVAVIIGNSIAALAAKAATTTVPTSSRLEATPSGTASSPASAGRLATSRASTSSPANWGRETTGTTAPACAQGDNHCHAREPEPEQS
jgi:putative ABC transport system substrate-binding protein